MSLESLRHLRAQTEEAITMELARITQEMTNMESACRAWDKQIRTEGEAYRRQVEQGLAVEALLEWQARLDAQEASLARARRAIGSLHEAWTAAHGRLLVARQERKVLDRLAERRAQTQRMEAARREQQALDEAAQRRHRPMETGTP
jgi:flagellar export protein FliJ